MAARLIGRIPRYGHVSDYRRDVLHWLSVPQRIIYRVSTLVWRCIVGAAPVYLQELCCCTLNIHRHGSLRSSRRAELIVPRSRISIMQRRAFSVAGPAAWNALPVALRLMPGACPSAFYTSLKTLLFGLG